MGRRRKPPGEPKPAIIMPSQHSLHVRCWHCGQRLPDVMENLWGEGFEVTSAHYSVDGWGWALDGETLRPTKGLLARQQRAREIVRLGGGREVKTRRKLAGKASLLPISHKSVDPVIANYLGSTIEQVECPRCGAHNLLVSDSAVR